MSDWIEMLIELPGHVLDFSLRFFEPVLVASLTSGVAAAVFLILAYGVWAALSAGLQREERSRCLIQVIEIALKQGQSVERTIAALAQARVKDMGVLFHLLAAWMDRGLRLGAALDEVPRLLPPQVKAMLQVGESVGDLGRVLPACRASLQDGSSDSRKQLNSTLVLLFVSPIGPAVIWVLSIYVFPKFRDIAADMELALGQTFDRLIHWSLIVGMVTAGLWLVLWLFESGRAGGSWVLRGLGTWMEGPLDWISYRVPWRRKRIQRDFSAMLASMLDAGLPEERAIELAAQSVANRVVLKRAQRALAKLRGGLGLARAMEDFDDAGEFGWRLRNACQSQHGGAFAAALAGWNESLEARAFQEEQIFSQATSTGFVLLNGLMIGLACGAVFRFLLSAIQATE